MKEPKFKIYIDSITKEEIKIDKKITVFIKNSDWIKYELQNGPIKRFAYTLYGFQTFIALKEPEIFTTMTCAINSKYFEMGYDIIIISDGKQISFYDDIMNNPNCALTYGKEIRLSHNWEKMFHAGCFNIKYNWENIGGDIMIKSSNDGNIIYHITKDQAELICQHYGKDINTLEEYEICGLLDDYIDELVNI